MRKLHKNEVYDVPCGVGWFLLLGDTEWVLWRKSIVDKTPFLIAWVASKLSFLHLVRSARCSWSILLTEEICVRHICLPLLTKSLVTPSWLESKCVRASIWIEERLGLAPCRIWLKIFLMIWSRSSWLSLVFKLIELVELVLRLVDSGGWFVVGQVFAVQGLNSKMELFLHSLCQAGIWFLNNTVCGKWGCWAKVET